MLQYNFKPHRTNMINRILVSMAQRWVTVVTFISTKQRIYTLITHELLPSGLVAQSVEQRRSANPVIVGSNSIEVKRSFFASCGPPLLFPILRSEKPFTGYFKHRLKYYSLQSLLSKFSSLSLLRGSTLLCQFYPSNGISTWSNFFWESLRVFSCFALARRQHS